MIYEQKKHCTHEKNKVCKHDGKKEIRSRGSILEP